MSRMIRLTRRGFLAAFAALGAGSLIGCGGGAGMAGPEDSSGALQKTVMYRLSTKGQRASNAAKANAANKRFATMEAAEAGRAHPGDRAKIVQLDVSPETWDKLFQDGARLAVDLRSL